jgi:hypothetical protein
MTGKMKEASLHQAKILAKQFPEVGLHGRNQDFVDRCIKLLQRANYRAKSDE